MLWKDINLSRTYLAHHELESVVIIFIFYFYSVFALGPLVYQMKQQNAVSSPGIFKL